MNDETTTNGSYWQIYCDRGNGLELDGCWGSEHAQFDTEEEALDACAHLARTYTDCKWVAKLEERQ